MIGRGSVEGAEVAVCLPWVRRAEPEFSRGDRPGSCSELWADCDDVRGHGGCDIESKFEIPRAVDSPPAALTERLQGLEFSRARVTDPEQRRTCHVSWLRESVRRSQLWALPIRLGGTCRLHSIQPCSPHPAIPGIRKSPYGCTRSAGPGIPTTRDVSLRVRSSSIRMWARGRSGRISRAVRSARDTVSDDGPTVSWVMPQASTPSGTLADRHDARWFGRGRGSIRSRD